VCPPRRFANLDGVVLHWQTKAIPANWMVHIVALLTLQARLDVGKLKRPTVTNVNTRTSDARKHAETIVLWARRITKVSDIRTVSLPFILPFFLNFRRIISFHTRNYIKELRLKKRSFLDVSTFLMQIETLKS